MSPLSSPTFCKWGNSIICGRFQKDKTLRNVMCLESWCNGNPMHETIGLNGTWGSSILGACLKHLHLLVVVTFHHHGRIPPCSLVEWETFSDTQDHLTEYFHMQQLFLLTLERITCCNSTIECVLSAFVLWSGKVGGAWVLDIQVTKKFAKRKQAHVGMKSSKTNQTRRERHHNTFTPSLHLVPFCQNCVFVFVF